MNKSFDYFKMLKEMSDDVSSLVVSLANKESLNDTYFIFNGKRRELAERLADDFVAPIERNDIYNLSYCIYDEYCTARLLNSVAGISDFVPKNLLDKTAAALLRQSEIICSFSQKSKYNKGMNNAANAQMQVVSLKSEIAKSFYSVHPNQQSLYRYVVLNDLSDFCSQIITTLCLCERIFINNI